MHGAVPYSVEVGARNSAAQTCRTSQQLAADEPLPLPSLCTHLASAKVRRCRHLAVGAMRRPDLHVDCVLDASHHLREARKGTREAASSFVSTRILQVSIPAVPESRRLHHPRTTQDGLRTAARALAAARVERRKRRVGTRVASSPGTHTCADSGAPEKLHALPGRRCERWLRSTPHCSGKQPAVLPPRSSQNCKRTEHPNHHTVACPVMRCNGLSHLLHHEHRLLTRCQLPWRRQRCELGPRQRRTPQAQPLQSSIVQVRFQKIGPWWVPTRTLRYVAAVLPPRVRIILRSAL